LPLSLGFPGERDGKLLLLETMATPKNTTATTEQAAASKIRVKIRAYDNKIIDKSTRTIIETATRTGAEVVGPVPLPTEKTTYTVLRSTFVHKSARDQYEMRVHKRLIDIVNPTAKTIEELSNLNLPSGVDIEMKMM
jgi:small subunit ribosomal protein S10